MPNLCDSGTNGSYCIFTKEFLYMGEAQELTVGKNVAALKVSPLVAWWIQHIKIGFLFLF